MPLYTHIHDRPDRSLQRERRGGNPAPRQTSTLTKIPTSAKVPIPLGTYNNLDQLATHCKGCVRCELAETRTNVVVSRGNPNAPILIIGEGPGQQEDEQGLPFVGRSGQLLEKILAAVRLDSEKRHLHLQHR